ncbi:MAG TPA: quinol:electron acceptor oxidoreductase subunit ActD [Bacteroidota bacterium]|nr:quinol:electron acceptor oxidoreductase subunit ActD [Bacteroidota bacterium]
MSEKPLYAVAALFDSPSAIMHAAEETAKAGFTKYDVNTPYPVHGMDHAMRLRTSRMGYFAFAFGLFGTISAMLLMTWITLVDYPLVIGGKPFWSWPAFVPIAFEVTVLSAAVLSVLAMIVIYFKFPNVSHPLHDTAYMKAVSEDRFGIYVHAADPLFDEAKVRKHFASLGAVRIDPVYVTLPGVADRPRLFEKRFMGVLAATAIVTVAVTYFSLNKLLYMEPFNWMMDQNKLKPQKPSTFFRDGMGQRQPVPGTVARGFMPYPFKGKPDDAGKYLVNPLLPTKEVVDRGKTKFLTFCSPCHGNFGRGDSRLQGQFPSPPTLHSDKVRNWPDGNIYHVITEGQNVMPSYATQIPRDDRWAIIEYIRVLQRAQNPKESDLK